jgi:hypothetical protein
MKRQHTEREKIFASYSSGKGLLTSRRYKELKKTRSVKRTNNPATKWAKI